MTEKGKLRVVWDSPEPNRELQIPSSSTAGTSGASPVESRRPPAPGPGPRDREDPRGDRDDGLPGRPPSKRPTRSLFTPDHTCPLSPGRCVAGWVASLVDRGGDVRPRRTEGNGRGDPRGPRGPRPRRQGPVDQHHGRVPALVYAHPARQPTPRGGPPRGSCSAAYGTQPGRQYVPALIDPDKRAVAVADFRFPLTTTFADTDCPLTVARPIASGGSSYPRLFRVSFPGTTREVLAEGLPQGVTS